MAQDQQRPGDRKLDEGLEETFPASDAPANTVETGIHVGWPGELPPVTDNREARQFELSIDGQTAVLVYDRTPDSLVLAHTEVPALLRGRHLGDVLAKAALASGAADGLRIVVVCPFVRAFLRRHPEIAATARPPIEAKD